MGEGLTTPILLPDTAPAVSVFPCWVPLWLCSLPVVVCLTIRLHGTSPLTQHMVGEHQLKLLVLRE